MDEPSAPDTLVPAAVPPDGASSPAWAAPAWSLPVSRQLVPHLAAAQEMTSLTTQDISLAQAQAVIDAAMAKANEIKTS